MRHPKRLLQEYLDGQATPARAAAVQAHLQRCAACRAEAARERRLRSRLRSLEVPAPSPDLRARIEHTVQIAGNRTAGNGSSGGYAATPASSPSRTHRRRMLTAAGLLAAAACTVLSTAYLLGGWAENPSPQAASPGLAAGWTEVTGGEEAHALAPEQLAQLRARGWACPELASAGMTMVEAKAARVDGQPAVIMTLEGNGSTVTVYETHPDSSSEEAAVDGVSGRPVSDEGFVLREQAPGRPQVWTHPQRPHRAILASSRVTYTVDAAPPGDVLEEAVAEISLSESSRLVLHSPDTAQGVWDRIRNGLAVMAGGGPRE